jgi:2-keto-3-deoxy-L-rhamnonate aldolase RhmA
MSSYLAKLRARPTVGIVLQTASPLVANSMSAAGFDWLVIDPINSPLSQLESFAMQTTKCRRFQWRAYLPIPHWCPLDCQNRQIWSGSRRD